MIRKIDFVNITFKNEKDRFNSQIPLSIELSEHIRSLWNQLTEISSIVYALICADITLNPSFYPENILSWNFDLSYSCDSATLH